MIDSDRPFSTVAIDKMKWKGVSRECPEQHWGPSNLLREKTQLGLRIFTRESSRKDELKFRSSGNLYTINVAIGNHIVMQ